MAQLRTSELGRNSVAEWERWCAGGPSRSGQREFRAQPANRRGPERQHAAVEAGKLDDDREAQARAGLALVEPAPAQRHLFALGRRKTRSVVVDDDTHARLAIALETVRDHFDGDARLRPLAGIVD